LFEDTLILKVMWNRYTAHFSSSCKQVKKVYMHITKKTPLMLIQQGHP